VVKNHITSGGQWFLKTQNVLMACTPANKIG